jgi:hypothetical protein
MIPITTPAAAISSGQHPTSGRAWRSISASSSRRSSSTFGSGGPGGADMARGYIVGGADVAPALDSRERAPENRFAVHAPPNRR